MFLLASVTHLQMEASDHCSILIKIVNPENKERQPFRFFQAWSSKLLSFDVIHQAWNNDKRLGMKCHQLTKSLRNTTSALKTWYIGAFRYAYKQISDLEVKLQILQKQENSNLAYQEEIQDKLRTQRNRMESINRQKSQELWLKNRDKNSKFFHVSTFVRRRHNQINSIETNSEWITDEKAIAEVFITNVKELF